MDVIKRIVLGTQRIAVSFAGWSAFYWLSTFVMTEQYARYLTDALFGLVFGTILSIHLFKKPEICYLAKNERREEDVLLYALGNYMYRMTIYMPLKSLGQPPLPENQTPTIWTKIMRQVDWLSRLSTMLIYVNNIKQFLFCCIRGFGSHAECASLFNETIFLVVDNVFAFVDDDFQTAYRKTYFIFWSIMLLYKMIIMIFGTMYLGFFAIISENCVY